MMNKRKTIIVICVCLLLSGIINTVYAAGGRLQIGDYINIGTYNGVPITWRYVVDDEYGKLLISDKVICYKRFDVPSEDTPVDDFWETSCIRSWLNSDGSAGNVIWNRNIPQYPGIHGELPYADESGFLSNDNFTKAERRLMKPVTQWTMLPAEKREFSENGLDSYFSFMKSGPVSYGPPHEDKSEPAVYYQIEDIPDIYYGAAYQLKDTVFLPDAQQLYRIWENFGTVAAQRTIESKPNKETYNLNASYFLKHDGPTVVWSNNQLVFTGKYYDDGIRPAFYLNEDAIDSVRGSGTEYDPYILVKDSKYSTATAPQNISVQMDGKALSFDVAPVMQNNRVLVPFRAIFEAFGANVYWYEKTETVTATKGSLNLMLKINNSKMTVNGKEITLDVPPRLVGDRTLVPIRAVSEGLGADVDWDEANNKVIITTK